MARPDVAALLQLAESVADGTPIDWTEVEDSAAADTRGVVHQLRVLANLATLHRTTSVGDVHGMEIAARRFSAAPAIGTWAHLSLIERLGGGTFGDVYKAWDPQLEREVALKLLREVPSRESGGDAQLSRIANEGRLLARINHPNVVHVYGVATHEGRVGLWMELVRGETLEDLVRKGGPLSAREAAVIGIDLCRSLAALHGAGLIHRDIKAQNVMREEGGRILLMDLGTGREIGPRAFPDLVGTPLYLAPEIFGGSPANERTDIYSLGVLLYRLVTGSFPVSALSIEQLEIAHATGRQVRLRDARADLPTGFVTVVDRAIASDPARRYATAGELEAGLVEALGERATGRLRYIPRGWKAGLLIAAAALLTIVLLVRPGRFGGPGAGEIRSIAVLPMANLSGDPSQEYFADGMTEALISDLATIRALRVISRTSVMQFKGTRKPIDEIADALNVDAVLEASVLKFGDRVRISADLVQVATDRHIWAETYERDVRDVLALQNDLARTIASQVRVQVTPRELAGFGTSRSVQPAAQEAYLQGRYYWNKRTREELQKALDYFREAARIDSTFGKAYAGQADTYNLLPPGGMSPFVAYSLAKDAARRALDIDPNLAEAHTSLAFATFIFDRDWRAAEEGFKRAVELSPGYETAHHWYGEYLSVLGRFDEAMTELEQARRLDPLSVNIRNSIGTTLYFARRYDDAITELQKSLELDSGRPLTHYYLAASYEQHGMLVEAMREVRRGLELAPRFPLLLAESARLAALNGDRSAALSIANELAASARQTRIPAEAIAYIYAGLGDHDRLFEFLNQAEAEFAPAVLWIRSHPEFDSIRSDPRYADLLRRLRLPQ